MRASRLLLLLAALVLGWSTFAQQQEPSQGQVEDEVAVEQEEPLPEEPAEESPAVQAESAGRVFEAFDPSEDISEDLSVPFPVDI